MAYFSVTRRKGPIRFAGYTLIRENWRSSRHLSASNSDVPEDTRRNNLLPAEIAGNCLGNKMKRLLFFIFLTSSLSSLSASAAEIPREFSGIWTPATDAENQCKKGDWESNRNDGMISVANNSIEYWESSCRIQSAKRQDESTYVLDLTCGGEGQGWRSKEVWHFEKVGSREQLVVISLDRFDERDDAGKRLRNPTKHQIHVGVYLGCK